MNFEQGSNMEIGSGNLLDGGDPTRHSFHGALHLLVLLCCASQGAGSPTPCKFLNLATRVRSLIYPHRYRLATGPSSNGRKKPLLTIF